MTELLDGTCTSLPICVVDDDRQHLAVMSLMLRRMGFHNVRTFSDARDAWSHICANGSSLIISDWNMDPMTGIELLTLVRSSATTHNIPFVMVTANCDADYWKRAIKAGVTEFLFKPLSYREFEGAVSQRTRQA